MSIVRNNLFEKFVEDSDPIDDMGIGKNVFMKREFETVHDYYKWLLKPFSSTETNLQKILDIKVPNWNPRDIILKFNRFDYIFLTGFNAIRLDEYNKRYITINRGAFNERFFAMYIDENCKKDKVNEKFIEDSDPIADMGIGGDEWKFKNLKTGDILRIKRPTVYYGDGGFLIITQDIEKRPQGDKYSHALYYYYVSSKSALKNLAKQFKDIKFLQYMGKSWIMNFKFYKDTFEKMPYTLNDIVKNPKTIFETFTQDSDPIKDMGIGTMKLIKDFINSLPYSEEIDEEDYLDYCAEYGKYDFVKYLLSIGYKADSNNSWALRIAALTGHFDVVKLLLENGADPREGNWDALRAAIENSRIEIIKMILDYAKKLEIEKGTTFKGRTFMPIKSAIIAARHHANEKVQKFLNNYLLKLNEAFTEDSDPIEDMGIGVKHVFNNIKEGDIFKIKKDLHSAQINKDSYIKIIKVFDIEKNKKIIFQYNLFDNLEELKQNNNEEGFVHAWQISLEFFKDNFEKINPSIIYETKKIKQSIEVKPKRYVYHKSNPIFREKILREGLIPQGKSEAWLSDTKIKGKVIFVTNSENEKDWFYSTYDDDIYRIDTTKINNKWYKDINFGLDNHNYMYTFQPIPLNALELIYKGTGESFE